MALRWTSSMLANFSLVAGTRRGGGNESHFSMAVDGELPRARTPPTGAISGTSTPKQRSRIGSVGLAGRSSDSFTSYSLALGLH